VTFTVSNRLLASALEEGPVLTRVQVSYWEEQSLACRRLHDGMSEFSGGQDGSDGNDGHDGTIDRETL
jgi:hypothetical protein